MLGAAFVKTGTELFIFVVVKGKAALLLNAFRLFVAVVRTAPYSVEFQILKPVTQ
jgi:hypothetical protein